MRCFIGFFGVCMGVAALAQPAFGKSAPMAHGTQGMVVSTQSLATQVGVDVLKNGGNAIDAAVAVGYALAVVHPAAGNIGGGGFMTIRFADGRTRFIDFRERAPLAASATMFQDKDGNVIPGASEMGYRAAGIPGTVRGFELALKNYGSKPLAELVAPAITLAEKGFELRGGDVQNIRDVADKLAKDPEAARLFLKDGANPLDIHSILRQPELAATLRQIAEGGADAFYKGPIADQLVAASQAHGGIFQRQDFEQYRPREHDPIQCSYRGYDITTAAPPSSGGVTLCEALNILEGYDMAKLRFHSAASLHILAEAMRFSFFDRNSNLGDPDFVQNPVAKLIDKTYAAQVRARIPADRAQPSMALGSVAIGNEGPHTTDYSVIDKQGNAVSVVYTLNDWFGSKVVATGTGIVLNNEMDDFSAKPGAPNEDGLVTGVNNAIAPGKAPLSSMTPTILSRNGKTVLSLGSFGSGTIITSVLQTIVNLVDYHMTLAQAVDAPRIHQQWLPDNIAYDEGVFTRRTAQQMTAMGYSLSLGTIAGATEAILVGGEHIGDSKAGLLVGVNDRRAPVGAAIGY